MCNVDRPPSWMRKVEVASGVTSFDVLFPGFPISVQSRSRQSPGSEPLVCGSPAAHDAVGACHYGGAWPTTPTSILSFYYLNPPFTAWATRLTGPGTDTDR